jgi:hypothetical protein
MGIGFNDFKFRRRNHKSIAIPGITITAAITCGKNESEMRLEGLGSILARRGEKKAGNPTYRG